MSKLRRWFSGVFRGKKVDPTVSGSLGDLLEDPEDEAQIPPLVHEYIMHEHQLQQALANSLHDQNETLQQERSSQHIAVSHLEE